MPVALVGASEAIPSSVPVTQNPAPLVNVVMWNISLPATAVGYDDVCPRTDEGRFIAILVMIVGIGFVAVLTAAIAQQFVAIQVRQQVEDPEEVLEGTEEQVLAEIRDIGSRLQVLEASEQRLARRSN